MVLKHLHSESTLMIFNGSHWEFAIKMLPKKIILISDLTKMDMDVTWSVEMQDLGHTLNLILIMLSKLSTSSKETQLLVQ